VKAYLYLGAVVAVLALCAGAGRWGYVTGGNAVRVEMQKAVEKARIEAKAADSRYTDATKDLESALEALATLRDQPPPDPQILIKRIPSDAPDCTCADRSDDYFRLYNDAAGATSPP
jgi:hypothetical protein